MNEPMQVIFADLAGKIPIHLAPAAKVPAENVAKVSGDWQARIIWDPDKKREVDEAAGEMAKLFGDVPVKYKFPFSWKKTADTTQALHRG